MQPADYVPDRVIVHAIPKHKAAEPGPGPILSDVVDDLAGDLHAYFTEKIRATLTDKGHQVVGDPASESGVPRVIGDLLRGDADLLSASRDLAQQLYETQSGTNSAGLLVALSGNLDQAPGLAILKLERQQGVRVKRESVDGGRIHFNISHLRDLMLNERTRVFKAGLFALTGDGSIEGVVSDEQRGHRRDEVATFFLSRYLGCTLRINAQASTKAFFMVARTWVNDIVEEPDQKTRYALAVISEMNAESRDLDPGDFAARNLAADDREGFLRYLAGNQVPTTVFQKDTKLIQAQIRSLRLDIENNIVILVPPQHADQVSFTTDASDDTPVTEVRGALKGFGGR